MKFKIIGSNKLKCERHEAEDSITLNQIIFMQGPEVPRLGIDCLFCSDSIEPTEFELCSLTSTCESGSTFNAAELRLIADNLSAICKYVLIQYNQNRLFAI